MDKNAIKKEKLHIGYLLPDWREADTDFFRTQLLTKYNKNLFQLFCYAGGGMEKFIAFKDDASTWRDFSGMHADLAAQTIGEDKIDILVDLSNPKHSFNFEVLSRKPAPVQVCFVGYFNTMNLKTVDYLLTDKYCDPLGLDESYFMETPYRLPQSHFCYETPKNIPYRKKNPFKENGYITFGSFHHFTKLNDEFLAIWGGILNRLPMARLILKNRIFGSGYGCQETKFRLKRLGVPVERVDFLSSHHTDLEGYEKIDIVLDTYPYQGGRSTCDALYMGNPVITMAGSRHSMRFGYSILKNIGLEGCIAFNAEDYIRKAVLLAENPYKLMNLQKNLRERMLRSPLMDSRRYVGNVDRAYQTIWQMRLDRIKMKKLSLEIQDLLHTVKDSLVYICANIVRADRAELICQMTVEAIYAFEKMEATLANMDEFSRYRDDFDFFIKKMRELKRLQQNGAYREAGLLIQTVILVRLTALIVKIK